VGQAEIHPTGFGELLGVEWLSFDPDDARARIKIEDHHLQPFGVVHGGVYCSLAESICSAAAYYAVREDDQVAMGHSNDTTFMRSIADGHVNATARTRHRGRSTWIFDVEMTDDEGRVCALARIVIAIRPRRST
jgi:1,4-dihydroxy-2-naphthoyl-CoA hydrolase